MATAAMFDTLRFSRRLKAVGFTPEQAEGVAEAIAEEAFDQLATRQDLVLVRQEIATLRQEMQNKIDKLELVLTIRMGVVAAAVVAANHYWK